MEGSAFPGLTQHGGGPVHPRAWMDARRSDIAVPISPARPKVTSRESKSIRDRSVRAARTRAGWR